MTDLKLSFAMTPYDRMLPLINGEVKPDGITLDYMGTPGGIDRVYYEDVKFQRYDVAEESFSDYLIMRAHKYPYRMLPVFHNRNFAYAYIHIRKSSGIRQGHPEDLKGKRMGIEDYVQSRALWIRGVLQMEFGIKPEDMVWYQERGEHFSQSGAVMAMTGLKLPSTLTLHYAKEDMNTMFRKGELDAACEAVGTFLHTSVIDRKHPALPDNPDIVTLFPDYRQEAIRFFKKYGIYPTHHTTMVRESILEEHPWVAISLMEAFEASKRIAIERHRRQRPSLMVFAREYLKELDDVFGPDPFPYGIKVNAKTIDMAQTFSVQQGLTKRKQPLDEIFPQEVILSEERL